MKVGELRRKLSYFSDDDDICFVDYNDDRVLTFQADVSWIHDGVYKSKTGEIYLSAIPLSDSELLGEFNVIYLKDIVYPEAETLSQTLRGDGGFSSTGL